MTLLQMAWRNLLNRRVQTLITVIVILIGVSMALSIMMLSDGIKQGIVKASEPYGMIVGSKGSANQLVFNTIFLMDNPLANISLDYYRSLEADPRVNQAVPFALGDNYKGFRIVGTSAEFFTLKGKLADPPYFRLATGRIFDKAFEAVIGSKVAGETGLAVGDTFVSGHGVAVSNEQDEHKETPYTVVGILNGVSAPSDKGIYVTMDSYWVSHGQHGHDEDDETDHDQGEGVQASAAHKTSSQAKPGQAALSWTTNQLEAPQGVTAALIKPKSYMDLMKMYQEINQGARAQAVFPGQIIAKIFDMMGSGEQVLKYISYVVLGMSGLTIILALYGSTMERRRTVSILRAIGASRNSVLAIVLLECVLIVVLGCIGGIAGGYLLTLALSMYIGTQISITVIPMYNWELLSVVGVVGCIGIFAGILPAMSAYRMEVARYLNSQ
ncbi:putative ABC transport system permease protein [Paenibacillus sp. 1_12]|uniref:ABC transporter permease n=1 Tax=Paenibacillus sp. 1_12 TaxID=1566278 RepID=UPI0008EFFCEF|nr:ABC transporter permease [Paenibacillus sp. 1_12]SFL82084.1 putative ABC transport system permease protein [Paenibacillus sp. 1_12]